MAISAYNVHKIITGFGMIFHQAKPVLEGKKEDGGYEMVSVVVQGIMSREYKLLNELTDSIHHSFCIMLTGEGMKLCFF